MLQVGNEHLILTFSDYPGAGIELVDIVDDVTGSVTWPAGGAGARTVAPRFAE